MNTKPYPAKITYYNLFQVPNSLSSPNSSLLWRRLGLCDYAPTWQAMRDFTNARAPDTGDELWTLQHLHVFTQGQAGRAEHLLNPGDIPVLRSDRGGQVTYHGPGQIVAYLLYDLRHGGIGIRTLVQWLERAVIDLLGEYTIEASLIEGAPGVYVRGRKIASVGLRVRHGCCYHGISLNADMDLEPFGRINPCGHPGLKPVQISELAPGIGLQEIEQGLARTIAHQLGLDMQSTGPNTKCISMIDSTTLPGEPIQHGPRIPS